MVGLTKESLMMMAWQENGKKDVQGMDGIDQDTKDRAIEQIKKAESPGRVAQIVTALDRMVLRNQSNMAAQT